MMKILRANRAVLRIGVYVFVTLSICAAAAAYIGNERMAKAQYNETNNTTSLIVRSLTADDHVQGDRNAPFQLIVYSDFSCPYCKSFFSTTLPRLQAQYGSQIVIVFRHLPLIAIHPRAFREAEASECAADIAGEDAFWEFEQQMYAHPDFENGLSDSQLTSLVSNIGIDATRFAACMASGAVGERIRKDMTEAAVAGLNYTPTTVLKSAHRALVVKGAYHPRYVTAIDYIMSVEKNIADR